MPATGVITVRDSNSHAILVGASVFINGAGLGSTDSNGHLSITLPVGPPYTLTAKATGYQLFSSSYLAGQSLIADLAPIAQSGSRSFTLSLIPDALAVGTSITFSNNGNPITQVYQAGGLTVTGLTGDQQTVTASVPGFNLINTSFDVSQASSATLQMSVATDSGLKQATQPAVIQDPDTSTLLPALTSEDLPGFIPPNTGQGTYFTMTQARMYVGGLFIDELNSLQFALQTNKIPIYGYASRDYDIVAQGKSLVQGQFSINFISEGYLVVTLREYQRQLNSSVVPINQVVDEQQQRLLQLVNKLQNPDPAWTVDMVNAAKAEINNLAASLGPTALQAAQSGINAALRQQNNSILGLSGGDYPNAVYEDIGFDIIVEYTGAGRTITRRLEDCHLISNESIMDHSGTPILDSYGFIARRLR